jgi:hypothetical protein
MPEWARMNSTRNAPLSDRMASAFENGYGDEGPLAKGLVYGCCLIPAILIVPAFIGGICWFLWWI